MKWIKATILAIVLVIIIMGSLLVFSNMIAQKAEIWADSNVLLSYPQKLGLSISSFFRQYAILLSPVVLILCFATTFIITALKKRK